MKKSIYIAVAAIAATSLAMILLTKKSKSKLKITRQCCNNSDKTENVVTSKEIKGDKTVEVALPINNSRGSINLALNNAFIGNVTYNIIIK
jgi:hypothetical protein